MWEMSPCCLVSREDGHARARGQRPHRLPRSRNDPGSSCHLTLHPAGKQPLQCRQRHGGMCPPPTVLPVDKLTPPVPSRTSGAFRNIQFLNYACTFENNRKHPQYAPLAEESQGQFRVPTRRRHVTDVWDSMTVQEWYHWYSGFFYRAFLGLICPEPATPPPHTHTHKPHINFTLHLNGKDRPVLLHTVQMFLILLKVIILK